MCTLFSGCKLYSLKSHISHQMISCNILPHRVKDMSCRIRKYRKHPDSRPTWYDEHGEYVYCQEGARKWHFSEKPLIYSWTRARRDVLINGISFTQAQQLVLLAAYRSSHRTYSDSVNAHICSRRTINGTTSTIAVVMWIITFCFCFQDESLLYDSGVTLYILTIHQVINWTIFEESEKFTPQTKYLVQECYVRTHILCGLFNIIIIIYRKANHAFTGYSSVSRVDTNEDD